MRCQAKVQEENRDFCESEAGRVDYSTDQCPLDLDQSRKKNGDGATNLLEIIHELFRSDIPHVIAETRAHICGLFSIFLCPVTRLTYAGN
jgi:hypothetical protein